MNAPFSSPPLAPQRRVVVVLAPCAATFSFIWIKNKWNSSSSLSPGSQKADWLTDSGNAYMRTSKRDSLFSSPRLYDTRHQYTNNLMRMHSS